MGMHVLRPWIAGAAAALPATAFAHVPTESADDRSVAWLVVLLAATTLAYAAGVAALWRRAGRGRGIGPSAVVRFALGLAVLAAALLSPLDAIAGRSFAAHMVQHELLMVVAAPLLVLARPLEAFAWALPASARRALPSVFGGAGLRRAWGLLNAPGSAWTLHALAIWAWHVPALFDRALESGALHVLQHACFFVSALIFWWAALGRGTRRPDATSMALLFTTMLHTSALGLLLTFAPAAWYPHYRDGFMDLAALEDQQLGGLVMWVPGSLPYLAAGLAVVASWLSPRMRPRTG